MYPLIKKVFLFSPFFLGLATAACSEKSAQLETYDLPLYGLSDLPTNTELPFYALEIAETIPAPSGDWIHSLPNYGLCAIRGGHWMPSVGGMTDVNVQCSFATNEQFHHVQSYSRSVFGYYNGMSFVSGTTGHLEEDLQWFAISSESHTDLVSVSDGRIALRPNAFIPLPHPAGDSVSLGYAQGRIYVGVSTEDSNVLLAIDSETALVVQDYQDTIVATLESMELPEGLVFDRKSIAVSNQKLLVRISRSEAAVFDVNTGAHIGFVGNLPEGPITGDNDGFWGVTSSLQAHKLQWPQDPIRQLDIQSVRTFRRSGASHIAIGDDTLWVYYEDGANVDHVVGYDPTTFQPQSSFTLSDEALASIYGPDAEQPSHRLKSFAVAGRSFYFQTVNINDDASRNTSSGFSVVNMDSGALSAVFSVPGIHTTAICHNGTNLEALAMPHASENVPVGRPTLYSLDPANGLQRASYRAPVATHGSVGVICQANGFAYSGEKSRTWIQTSSSAETAQFSVFPFPSAGGSAAATGQNSLMLDRERNLLFVVSSPNSLN